MNQLEMNILRRKLDEKKKELEVALKENSELKDYVGHLEHEQQLLYGRLNNIIDLASEEIK